MYGQCLAPFVVAQCGLACRERESAAAWALAACSFASWRQRQPASSDRPTLSRGVTDVTVHTFFSLWFRSDDGRGLRSRGGKAIAANQMLGLARPCPSKRQAKALLSAGGSGLRLGIWQRQRPGKGFCLASRGWAAGETKKEENGTSHKLPNENKNTIIASVSIRLI